jgi:hypothetical protein
MSANSTILFEQIKAGFDKIEKDINSSSYIGRINNIVNALINLNIASIPQFDNIEEFISQINDVNTDAYKVDSVFALPENIKHQTGRGELSMLMMIKGSRKSLRSNNETGDITFDGKSYELKKESGILDFAIKTRGSVTDKYNELITIRCFCDKILNTYFVDSDITKHFNDNFRKKITEFSAADFQLFDDLLIRIKNDSVIQSAELGKILCSVVNNFSTVVWRKSVAELIVNSYSGGVIVYRKRKKGNRKVKRVDSKYELLDSNNVIVQNLTLGNIQLKIVN